MSRWGLMIVTVCALGLVSPAGATPITAGDVAPPQALDASLRPVARVETRLPEMRWKSRREGRTWSRAALMALRSHASVLPELVPQDIAEWCPSYASGDRTAREAFWVGLLSTLAKHESTFRPTAVGGGGRWYGLLQILPATARGYRCEARSPQALKNGSANLSCALRIMARTVPRDGVISRGMRGVAADWGPFHSRKKRQDMMAWMRAQPYCKGLARSLRPVARPGPVFSTKGTILRGADRL